MNELDLKCAQKHLRRLVVAYGSQSKAAQALVAYYGVSYDMAAGWFQWLRESRTNAFKSPGVALMLEQMPEHVNPYKPRERQIYGWP